MKLPNKRKELQKGFSNCFAAKKPRSSPSLRRRFL